MRIFLVLALSFLFGCSPTWEEYPYEIYYINGTKTLGYKVAEGVFIGRLDEPKTIVSNKKYISVHGCPNDTCAFYYIDKAKDHKFADHDEFVFGPYSKEQFLDLALRLGLPNLTEK